MNVLIWRDELDLTHSLGVFYFVRKLERLIFDPEIIEVISIPSCTPWENSKDGEDTIKVDVVEVGAFGTVVTASSTANVWLYWISFFFQLGWAIDGVCEERFSESDWLFLARLENEVDSFFGTMISVMNTLWLDSEIKEDGTEKKQEEQNKRIEV